MKAKITAAAIATALLGLSSAAFAQPSSGSVNAPGTPTSPSSGSGARSPRCDSMTGAAKERCVRDGDTKTEGSGSGASGSGSGASGSGSDAAVPGTSIGTGSVPSGAGVSPAPSAGAASSSGGGSTNRPGPESTGMGR
jgi:hypothetical protein